MGQPSASNHWKTEPHGSRSQQDEPTGGGTTLKKVSLLLLAGFANVAAAQGQGHVRAAASPDIAAFVTSLDSLRKAAKIPGLSVAVVKNKSIVLALGLGYADFETRVAATAETPYDIASVAKPLSAAVALRLVELGLLDLDKPMADYSDWADFCAGFSQQP